MAPENELIRKNYFDMIQQERMERIFAKGLELYQELNRGYQSKYNWGFQSKGDFMKIASPKFLQLGVTSPRSGERYNLALSQENIWRLESGVVIQLVAIDGVHLRNLFSEEEINVLSLDFDKVMSNAGTWEKREQVVYKSLSENEQFFMNLGNYSPGKETYLTYLSAELSDFQSGEFIDQVLSEF